MLDTLLNVGAKFLGGMLDRSAAKDAQAAQAAQAEANRQMQLDFAQKGIQWKVRDAEAAGVHPLFALGASTHSFAPVSLGSAPSASMGSTLADMGQDISRAVAAKSTAVEKGANVAQTALVLEGMKLDNDIKKAKLASDVKNLVAPGTPPELPEDKPGKRAFGVVGGSKIATDPGTSNVDDFWQKRYGEPGEWIGAPIVGLKDMRANKIGAVEAIRGIYNWLNTHADPQFGNKLFNKLRR